MDNEATTENNVDTEVDEVPTFIITLDKEGEPSITGNVPIPIPTMLGILDLLAMQLGSRYYAGVMQEKQQQAIMKPQIVVPNMSIKRPQ